MASHSYLAAILGVVSHQCLFIHGEWHMQAPTIARFYAALSILVFLCESKWKGGDILGSLGETLLLITAYAGALFTSIVIYRVFFHRLRNFPGPWMARCTKFWHVYKCVNCKNHLLLDDLYRQYGQFVRTGPEEITVFHPEVLSAVDGPGNSCTKAVWYDLLLPEIAINTTRSKSDHDKRRRIWDSGFSTRALENYEATVVEYGKKLESRVAELSAKGQPINVSLWFYWFTFDVMGIFAFARSFDMLQKEEWHVSVVMLRKAMRLLGPLSPVPWLAQIGFNMFPWLWVVRDWLAMLAWCRDRMSERLKISTYHHDVSHWLIEASKRTNTLEEDRDWLNGDAVTIIIAGSDTVAPTLVFTFYELALHPEQQETLREELSTVDIYNRKTLAALPHLNGIIKEALRIHPPVPTGGYRQSPADGMTISGHYIPSNVTIVAPRYTLGRLESCFERPEDFVPERWYNRSEMVREKRAFAPFAQGRYSCVGKSLALSELRFVTALLACKYKIGFATGENGHKVVRDLRDQFTAAPGELNLSFEPLENTKDQSGKETF